MELSVSIGCRVDDRSIDEDVAAAGDVIAAGARVHLGGSNDSDLGSSRCGLRLMISRWLQ